MRWSIPDRGCVLFGVGRGVDALPFRPHVVLPVEGVGSLHRLRPSVKVEGSEHCRAGKARGEVVSPPAALQVVRQLVHTAVEFWEPCSNGVGGVGVAVRERRMNPRRGGGRGFS